MTARSPSPHPLSAVLESAAFGRFPDADGGVDVLPPDVDGTIAVVALTGHAYVLAAVDPAEVAARAPEGGYGASLAPEFLLWLAGDDHKQIDTIDLLLVWVGEANRAARLAPTTDYDDHPRVVRARKYRHDVSVYASRDGLAIIGTGLAGRREIAVELFDPANAPRGSGRRLVAAGLAALPPDEHVWAQVSPGNARSLRAFLAAGFAPVGSEVLITPR